MKASELVPILSRIALGLILAGLCVAEFLGFRGLGVVLVAAGLVAYGGAAVARYLHWEHGE